MQVNPITSLSSLNQLQSITGTSDGNSGGSTDSLFSAMLEQMISGAANGSGSSTNDAATSAATSGDSSATSGVGGLSLQPQKLLQMLALQNMMSSVNATSIGSTGDDDDSDGDDSSDSLVSTSTGDDTMSQMLNTIMQQYMNSNSTDSSSNMDTLTQAAANISGNSTNVNA